MKYYLITRKTTYIEYVSVRAENEEEAIQKVEEDEYDDIIDIEAMESESSDNWTVTENEQYLGCESSPFVENLYEGILIRRENHDE